jgi:GTPase SAR1 family protein
MYCKNKSKLNRQERRSLENELNVKIANRDSMNVEDKNLNDHINLLEIKLEKIYQETAKGAQVRAQEQWVELGEKNNSYFLGLEKKRQVKKSINKIKNENNDIANVHTIAFR